jgi:hypothetical protein
VWVQVPSSAGDFKSLEFSRLFLFHRNLFGGIGNQDICAAVLTKKNISFSPLQTGLKSIH